MLQHEEELGSADNYGWHFGTLTLILELTCPLSLLPRMFLNPPTAHCITTNYQASLAPPYRPC